MSDARIPAAAFAHFRTVHNGARVPHPRVVLLWTPAGGWTTPPWPPRRLTARYARRLQARGVWVVMLRSGRQEHEFKVRALCR